VSAREWRRCVWHERRHAYLLLCDNSSHVVGDERCGAVAPANVVPPVPTLNPSSSLILPQPPPLPVSPAPGGSPHESQLSSLQPYPRPCSVFSGHPCNPSFCSVFHHGPCFPYYLPPLGQDLRLTIFSTDEDDSLVENGRDGEEHALSSIRDMFAALRACWVPPPKPEARHGMEWNTPSASPLSAMAP
jgi:hypothetical protein